MTEIFSIETLSDGSTPVRYSCQQLMGDNQASPLRVEYYYDILHDASANTTEIVAEGEAELLKSVAQNFGLIDGARCSIPPVTALWLIEVTSEATDEPVDVFDSCLELVPGPGQTCHVYKGTMEAYYLGVGDPDSFQNYIQQNLNSIGAGLGFEISYLGRELDMTVVTETIENDNLPLTASKIEATPTTEPERKFTFVGGLMVAGLLAAFLGVFFVLYRRRQKFLAAQETEIALSKSDGDDATPYSPDYSGSLRPHQLEPEIGEETIDGYEEEYPGSSYRFDLATSMKNELFNIHGKAPGARHNFGVGIEETSDSDADSWAQTDGTIGSLELQLEPITAEV